MPHSILASLAGLVSLAMLATAPPADGDCLLIEVAALGRAGHGANINFESAPHQLIRGLARLEHRVQEDAGFGTVRIMALEGSAAINVVPPRATARLEVGPPTTQATREQAVASLRAIVGPDLVVTPLEASCKSAE